MAELCRQLLWLSRATGSAGGFLPDGATVFPDGNAIAEELVLADGFRNGFRHLNIELRMGFTLRF